MSNESTNQNSVRTYKQQQELTKLLSLLGIVSIGTGINSFLFSSFPWKILDPAWQLNLISSLLSSAPFLLFGFLLIYLARFYNKHDQRVKAQIVFVSKASSIISIVFLILIPLQFVSAHQLIKKTQAQDAALLTTWRKSIRAIESTKSEEDFRIIVSNLDGSDRLPAVFDAPFPIVKERALTNLRSRFNLLKNRSDDNVPTMWQNFLGNAARNILQMLLLHFGFRQIANSTKILPSMSTGEPEIDGYDA